MRKLFLATAFFGAGLFFTSCTKCNDPREENGCIDRHQVEKNGNMPCTMELNPVCGCDGVTYGNPCEAERAGVVRYEKGECGKTSTTGE